MRVVFHRVFLAVLVSVSALASNVSAQQTGTLAGVVRDTQGAVLPGVVVTASSDALIGGGRTTPTGTTGDYLFTGLPPGTYVVTYELSGFTPLKREGVIILVAQTTRLDVELGLGTLQETVTVSGASPMVDVSSTVTQTNITKDLYDTIPTGRNPWVMAGLVPGVVTGRLDVGGTEGMQQYNLEAFGSADSQKSFSIDGLKTNWGGGSGGATMQYYGFEMYEEYNMQTASGTAESDVSGVYMNMVTKSGGNRFTSDHNFYFMNDALQGDNIDDELRARLGLAPGQTTGAAGNPVDICTTGAPRSAVPSSASARGSLPRCAAGGWTSFRSAPSMPMDRRPSTTTASRTTWARSRPSSRHRARSRSCSTATSSTASIAATRRTSSSRTRRRCCRTSQRRTTSCSSIRCSARRPCVDARFGRMWGTFPTRYQSDVQPTDIAVRDSVRNTRINAAETQSLNPNHRYQLNATLSYFADDLGAGTHDFKAGTQFSWEDMAYERIRNGDILLELVDGVATRAFLSNTPINSDHRLETWAAFGQDRWMIGRATINLGVRIDGVKAYLPAQASPAGTWVGERSFPEREVFNFSANVAPRLGVTYDLAGNGRTAIKAYYGRFYNQFGSELAESSNQNALAQLQVPWSDPNGNLRLDPGELNLSTFTGFAAGLFPPIDPDASRPFSDEFNVGIDHQLVGNLAVSASYHRRQHRDGLTVLDRARPATAYTPAARAYNDPERGAQTITVFSLDPTLVTRRDRIIANIEGLRSDYDGVIFNVNKRLSNGWQLLAGVTFQSHEGFAHSGTFTDPGTTTDFNNPNYVLNRDSSVVFTDIPWSFGLSGSYQLPYAIVFSGKYTSGAGGPLMRTLVVSGLPQGSETVWVQPRGDDRVEDVTQFVDVRFAKRWTLGTSRLEGTVDVFNLLNANHVTGQVEAIGTTIGRPNRILTPRIVRFGVTARF